MGDNLSIATGTRLDLSTGVFMGVVPWTPAAMSTIAWFDAQDYSTITESGTVSQWDDKSGNGNNAVQATGGSQPSYNATDTRMNNKPSIGYDGDVRKFLQTSTQFAHKEVYVVAYYDNATFGSWDIMVGAGENLADPDERFGGNSLQAYFQDNGSLTAYKNGSYVTNYADNVAKPVVLPMTTTLWDNTWDSDAKVMKWNLLSGLASWQRWVRHGAIGEVIMTDGTESADTRRKIEGYTAWRWGFQADLPAGHPYEDNPPFA